MSIHVVRWILLIEGWILLLGPAALIQGLAGLALDPNSALAGDLHGLDPDQIREGTKLLAKLMVVLMGIGILCHASAWGLKRNKTWAKWTAMAAGILQLPLFPIFTVAGGIVAWVAWKWQPSENTELGSHPDDRESALVKGLRTVITFGMLILACSQLYRFTSTLGLPLTDLGDFGLAYLFAGQFVVTILHELGHLFAALTVGFRFQVINIGPVTISKDARGRRTFHFDIKRVFNHSGFLGAIPKTEENLRSNMMMIVLAGPFVSLNVGAILFLAMLSTPGTSMAPYGEIMGYASVIFALDFAANLIPIGHCDGSMLLGLACNNQRGKKIVSALISAMHGDRAEVAAGEGSIEEQIVARKKAVESVREHNGGSETTEQAAQSYIQLGLAELQGGDATQAEVHLRKALAIIEATRTKVHPLLRGAAYNGLARTLHQQERYSESRAAGDQAIELYEGAKEAMPKMEDLLEIYLSIADLQLALRQYGDAIMTVEQALMSLPGGARNALITARLCRVHAAAMLGGKSAQAGDSVRRAANALQSSAMRTEDRVLAYTELGALACELWNTGSEEAGVQLARTVLSRLEAVHASVESLARARMVLADMLCRSGQVDEAEALLALVPDTLTGESQKAFLGTRGTIQMRLKRMDDALATYTQLLKLGSNERDIAGVKATLALVYESMNNAEETELHAREACNILVPLEHSDASEALFVLARVMWTSGDENAEAYFEEGRRILSASEGTTAAQRARFLETAAADFAGRNLKVPAQMLQRDAANLRSTLRPVSLTVTRTDVAVAEEEEEEEESE